VRVAAGLEYDGSGYQGWQAQKVGPSVQAAVEEALSAVAAGSVTVTCAGRTDAGVHAMGQVIHFDTPAVRTEREWTLGANSRLPPDIALSWARTGVGDFHARFDAIARTYVYVILNRPVRSALLRDRAFWVHRRLNERAMAAGAEYLLGRHDFSSFRAAGCQAPTPVRDIAALTVRRNGDFVRLTVTANAFLHHMVRNIAGSLVAVGKGRFPPQWIDEVLDARDRRQAGMTAPACGLYLMRVDYGQRLSTPDAGDPLAPEGVTPSGYDRWWGS
jgi:tRNA pseudouridine38-40 synthase